MNSMIAMEIHDKEALDIGFRNNYKIRCIHMEYTPDQMKTMKTMEYPNNYIRENSPIYEKRLATVTVAGEKDTRRSMCKIKISS